MLEANQELVLATPPAEAAEEQSRDAARRKDQFPAMLGHELRSPLLAIRNAAEVLKLIAEDDRRQPMLARHRPHRSSSPCPGFSAIPRPCIRVDTSLHNRQTFV